MTDPTTTVSIPLAEYRDRLRYANANALQVVATDLDRRVRSHPSPELDPGREWVAAYLRDMTQQLLDPDNPARHDRDTE